MSVPGLASQTSLTSLTGSPGAAGGAFLEGGVSAPTLPQRQTWLARVRQAEGMPLGQSAFDSTRQLQAELLSAGAWPEDGQTPGLYELQRRVQAVRAGSLDRGGVATSGGLVSSAPGAAATDRDRSLGGFLYGDDSEAGSRGLGESWDQGYALGAQEGARRLVEGSREALGIAGDAVREAAGLGDVPGWVLVAGGLLVVVAGAAVVVAIVRG